MASVRREAAKDIKLTLFTGCQPSPRGTQAPVKRRATREDESDEDQFRVPDVETKLSVQKPSHAATAGPASGGASAAFIANEAHLEQPAKRRRSRNPADKEHRRIKRLLRNRVSAQQARERKKVYVTDLEARAQELQAKNDKLEEKISTLMNENTMLRKVLINMRPKNEDFEANT